MTRKPLSLTSNLILVSSITLGSNLLAYVRQVLIARYYGANGVTDALFAASVVALISMQLVGASLTAVFVPVFAELRDERGIDHAWRYACNLLTITGAISLVLSLVAYVFSPRIVSLLAPGFEPSRSALAASLFACMCPLIFFNTVNGILAGIANAHRRFAAVEAGNLIATAVNVTVLLALVRHAGVHAAAAGSLAAAGIQFPFLLWHARRSGLKIHLCFDVAEPGLSRAVRLGSAVFLGTLVGFAAPIIDRMLSSYMPHGSLSTLDYAERLIAVFSAVVITPLGTILLTSFSDAAGQRQYDELAALLSRVLRVMSYVAAPCAVFLLVLADPLVALFFEHGAFNHAAAASTARIVRFYAFWIPLLAINTVVGRSFYAMQRVTVPVVIGVVGVLVNAALKLALAGPLQQEGLALATTLSSLVKAGLLIALMSRALPQFAPLSASASIGRSLGLAIGCGALAHVAFRCLFAHSFGNMPALAQAAAIAVPLGAGALAYVMTSFVLRCNELTEVRIILQRLVTKAEPTAGHVPDTAVPHTAASPHDAPWSSP